MSLFTWIFGKQVVKQDIDSLKTKLKRAEVEKKQLKEAVKLLSKRNNFEDLSVEQARAFMGMNNTRFDNLVSRGVIKQHFDNEGQVFYDVSELIVLKESYSKKI